MELRLKELWYIALGLIAGFFISVAVAKFTCSINTPQITRR